MTDDAGTQGPSGDSGDPGPVFSPIEQMAEIFDYGAQVWLEIGSRWYARAMERTVWSAEDVVGDCTDLVEHLTPLVEQSIDLTLNLLRPYAASFKVRRA